MKVENWNSLKVKKTQPGSLVSSKSNGNIKTSVEFPEVGAPIDYRQSMDYGLLKYEQSVSPPRKNTNSPQKWKQTKRVQDLLTRTNDLKMRCEDMLGAPAYRQTLMPSSEGLHRQHQETKDIVVLNYHQIDEKDYVTRENIPKHKRKLSDMLIQPGQVIPPILSIHMETQFEHFFLLKHLSAGHSGRVYLTQNLKTGFLYAIKIINRTHLTEQNFSQLLMEIRLQSFLDHPNIVKLYNISIDKESVYLVLEPCQGKNLQSVIKRQKRRFQEDQVRQIIKQVAKAVQHMHKNDIIHQQIKPQNILEHDGLYKICDFGWAVHSPLLRESHLDSLSKMQQEQNHKIYDSKVDIWNLGVLTYELLYGNIPFAFKQRNLRTGQVEEQIHFPEQIPASDTARQFMQGCLEFSTYKRFQLRQALEHPFLKRAIGLRATVI